MDECATGAVFFEPCDLGGRGGLPNKAALAGIALGIVDGVSLDGVSSDEVTPEEVEEILAADDDVKGVAACLPKKFNIVPF
jgi:hypothetical protein